MKNSKRAVAILLIVVIAGLSLGQLLTKGKGFSQMENRYLAPEPVLNWREVRTGRYMENLEDYLADHVPFRDQWIQIKNSIEYLSGRRQIGEIYFAPENRLVQVQDVSLEQLRKNMDSLSSWACALPEKVSVSFLLAPTAAWVYQDQLPEETAMYDPEEAIAVIKESLPDRVRLVSAYEALYPHRDEAIYFKTDHHWTMRGAAYAYEALCGEDVSAGRSYEVMATDFKGSLYSQAPTLGYPGENFEVLAMPGLWARWQAGDEQGTVLMPEVLDQKDKYTAFLGGNYGLTRISGSAASGEKVLILKDSYANIMMPFFAEQYQEVILADLRYYREDLSALLEAEQIERVICVYNMDFLCTDQNFLWLK